MQGRIKRAFLNAQFVGERRDLGGDAVAVERAAAGKDGEDEERQRALKGVLSRHT